MPPARKSRRFMHAFLPFVIARRSGGSPCPRIHPFAEIDRRIKPGDDDRWTRSDGKMTLEEIDGQRQRAVGLRLRVGLAAVAREGVVGAGIFVDGDQRIGRQPPLQQIVDLRLHPAVLHRHVQHERPVQVLRLADAVLDIGAVIGDRAVDVGAAAHQVAELAAEAVADRADLAVAFRDASARYARCPPCRARRGRSRSRSRDRTPSSRPRGCWSYSSTPGSCRQNRSGTRQTKPASANSCACARMVSLTPQISMMAMMAPAGVRSG